MTQHMRVQNAATALTRRQVMVGAAGLSFAVALDGRLAGAATLIWRNGAAHVVTVGRRNLITNAPVERDTIFRIASMTKPVTSVAALMLYDEARFDLDDNDYLHVLQDEVTPENEQQIREAVRQCPRQAISIREE